MKCLRTSIMAVMSIVFIAASVHSAPAQESANLPLAERGPYDVGRQRLTFADADRDDRELLVGVWYPAIKPAELTVGAAKTGRNAGFLDAEPDLGAALYPLILFSPWWSSNYQTDVALFVHLASHGFVVASIDHQCDYESTCLVDRPLDMLFVLDQLAGETETTLAGTINPEQTGVMGISFGGYTTLVNAGARVDPDYFLEWADDARLVSSNASDTYLFRTVVARWDEVAAYRAQFDVLQEHQPWPSISDERIRAALAIVPGPGQLLGEHGLESITVPTLLLAGTLDEFAAYEQEIVPMYAQLNPENRYLISFVGYGHHPENTPDGAAYYRHFSTAFFGYFLQGQEDYADYLTEAYVDDFEDLVWGVVASE
ncbi:MAG: hypothetical protein JW910_10040 [Anaerolineae bacterium]|nr:hypothetical protein [Anaerolineae bacterium]